MRVVLIQGVEADASGGRDNVAIIVCLNYVGGSAVFSRPSETVGVTNNEVVASVVNDSIVHDRKLVTTGVKLSAEEIQQRWELCIRGNLVSSRDTVTDITTLSNVTASAGRRSNYKKQNGKKIETTEQPHARQNYSRWATKGKARMAATTWVNMALNIRTTTKRVCNQRMASGFLCQRNEERTWRWRKGIE